MVFFDGFDITKEIQYFKGVPDLAARGIACLIVDGPGNGESPGFRYLYLHHETERYATEAYEYLANRPEFDPERINPNGDKRIILIDGRAVGAVKRVPKAGEARANLHVGARPEKATLSARDREICEAIGPELSKRGLLFVGIDVIGDYLTEINVTSPTGIQEIGRFDNVSLEAQLWDSFEARWQASRDEQA